MLFPAGGKLRTLVVFVALEAEEGPIRCLLDARRRLKAGHFLLTVGEFAGSSVVICRSGLGRRAAAAAEVVLSFYQPEAALSLGFAGGLVETQKAGDLIFSSELGSLGVDKGPYNPLYSDESLLKLAEQTAERAKQQYERSVSITVDSVVADPNGKRSLGRTSDAQVVEMEDYWLARAAKEQGTPFLAVRTVLDRLTDTIPGPQDLVREDGSMRSMGAVSHLLRNPRELPYFLRLARAIPLARHRLCTFTRQFLIVWTEEGLATL